MDPTRIPDHDALVELLSAPGAAPRIVLDVGGSSDLDGDGLVEASLDDAGELVLRDV
jgi:hypothetical protein